MQQVGLVDVRPHADGLVAGLAGGRRSAFVGWLAFDVGVCATFVAAVAAATTSVIPLRFPCRLGYPDALGHVRQYQVDWHVPPR